jgi:deoxyadenosine/deoxycytidine kinase
MIVSIEGNIGSGKSTLLKRLKEKLNVINNKIIFLQEPVDQWENIKDAKGLTMLEKFYMDQEKYSFSFQMMAYISRLSLLKEAVQNNPGAIIITERSLYTDKYVFAKMLYDDNKIEDVNYHIYLKWFETFAQDFPIVKTIYVKTSPSKCHERICKRSRDGENSISLNYLTNCDTYHNNMMVHYNNTLELDGNLEIDDMENQWIETIKKYIEIS